MPAGILWGDKGLVTAETWHRDPAFEVVDSGSITVEGVESIFDFGFVQTEITATVDGHVLTDPNKLAIVRHGGLDSQGRELEPIYLSAMGKKYGVNDYREHFSSIAASLLDLGCTISTVGTLGNGAKGFMSVELPDGIGDISLDGETIEGRFMINFGESVDGSASTTAAQTFNRIVCKNTFQMELIARGRIFAIRHTANASAAISEARRQLHKTIAQAQETQAIMERMANTTYVESQFVGLMNQIQGKCPEEEGRGQTAWTNKRTAIMERYNAADIDGVRDTVWGAFNAIQGYSQHKRGIRGNVSRDARNLEEVTFKGHDAFLVDATSALMNQAKVLA